MHGLVYSQGLPDGYMLALFQIFASSLPASLPLTRFVTISLALVFAISKLANPH